MATPTTRPHLNTPFDIASIRQRFEELERAVRQLQNNREPIVPSLCDLKDTNPLGQPVDGDVPTYNLARGLWLPHH